ncbi:hypothetical protein pipiens_017563 [Culex pipiens pipiens]|uniref:Uncharacterized protein n=1 Tax=Culex pipiens pipiens TaxID=38569 RepID=A0ABD1CG13_CULPP
MMYQVTRKRGRIKVGEAHCEIFSVDTGHRLVVPWQDICYLPQARCVGPALYVDARAVTKRYFIRTASVPV